MVKDGIPGWLVQLTHGLRKVATRSLEVLVSLGKMNGSESRSLGGVDVTFK